MFGYRYARSMDAFVLEESWQLLCFAEQSLRSCFLFRGAHFQKFANMLAHVSSRNAQIIVSVQSSPNRVWFLISLISLCEHFQQTCMKGNKSQSGGFALNLALREFICYLARSSEMSARQRSCVIPYHLWRVFGVCCKARKGRAKDAPWQQGEFCMISVVCFVVCWVSRFWGWAERLNWVLAQGTGVGYWRCVLAEMVCARN